MYTEIRPYDAALMKEIVGFRRAVYARSERLASHLDTWSGDELDEAAMHAVTYNETGEIVGAVRILEAETWTLDKRFPHEYNPREDVEFGRLGVASTGKDGIGIFLALFEEVANWCEERGYVWCYGFTISRLVVGVRKYGLPLELVSPTLTLYGEPTRLVRFSVSDLKEYVRSRRKK